MFILIGVDGKEYGPASAELIREWIVAGRASLTLTQACRDGETQLQLLGAFPEFSTADAATECLPTPAPTLPPVVPTDPAASPQAAIAVPLVEDPTLASRGARFLAKLIDGVRLVLSLCPAGIALLYAAFGYNGERISLPYFYLSGALMLLLAAIQITWLVRRGQTIGKMIMRVRIVIHPDGAPADFVHIILLRAVVIDALRMIPFVGSLFYLVDCCFIFSQEKRCLHDLIAGTKVVKAQP